MKFMAVFFTALLSGALVFAQSGAAPSVEDRLLGQEVMLGIIKELRQGTSYENKEHALDNAQALIASGVSSRELVEEVKAMGLEGTKNRLFLEGRLANNNTMLRMRAVQILGEVHTEDARRAVIEIMYAEPEPAVVVESIFSLQKIGGDGEEKSLLCAVDVFNTFHNRVPPDNRIANALLNFIAGYIQTDPDSIPQFLPAIAQLADNRSNYNTWVREKAKNLLKYANKSAANIGK